VVWRDYRGLPVHPSGDGRWPDVMLTDHIKPAAVKAGIGNTGWHTFRHSYSTLLHALNAKTSFEVGPGTYRVREVVRDSEATGMSALNCEVGVPGASR